MVIAMVRVSPPLACKPTNCGSPVSTAPAPHELVALASRSIRLTPICRMVLTPAVA